MSYGEIMKYKEIEIKFLPVEDPPKEIKLSKLSKRTIYRLETLDKDKEF